MFILWGKQTQTGSLSRKVWAIKLSFIPSLHNAASRTRELLAAPCSNQRTINSATTRQWFLPSSFFSGGSTISIDVVSGILPFTCGKSISNKDPICQRPTSYPRAQSTNQIEQKFEVSMVTLAFHSNLLCLIPHVIPQVFSLLLVYCLPFITGFMKKYLMKLYFTTVAGVPTICRDHFAFTGVATIMYTTQPTAAMVSHSVQTHQYYRHKRLNISKVKSLNEGQQLNISSDR